jgi:hypothetical protein
LNRTKTAGSGADIPENHNRGGAARPAFAHIGALRTLAHGVKIVCIDNFTSGLVAGAGGQLARSQSGLRFCISFKSVRKNSFKFNC